MRLLVMFDLPTSTKAERKAANQFRRFLLNDGYYMMQYSVYVRICNGTEAANKHAVRLQGNIPEKWSVRLLEVTERQYESMKILCGIKLPDVDENKQKNSVVIL